MARVKRGTSHVKHRKKLYKNAKGFSAGRKNTLRLAKAAVKKAGQRAYDHRKLKKRTARGLWQVKINAAVRAHGMSYSVFMGKLAKKNIRLDRKILAQLAEYYPEIFTKIIQEIQKP